MPIRDAVLDAIEDLAPPSNNSPHFQSGMCGIRCRATSVPPSAHLGSRTLTIWRAGSSGAGSGTGQRPRHLRRVRTPAPRAPAERADPARTIRPLHDGKHQTAPGVDHVAAAVWFRCAGTAFAPSACASDNVPESPNRSGANSWATKPPVSVRDTSRVTVPLSGTAAPNVAARWSNERGLGSIDSTRCAPHAQPRTSATGGHAGFHGTNRRYARLQISGARARLEVRCWTEMRAGASVRRAEGCRTGRPSPMFPELLDCPGSVPASGPRD